MMDGGARLRAVGRDDRAHRRAWDLAIRAGNGDIAQTRDRCHGHLAVHPSAGPPLRERQAATVRPRHEGRQMIALEDPDLQDWCSRRRRVLDVAIARFNLKAIGRPSHAGARLKEGRSAIRIMADMIPQIEGMTTDACTFSVGVVHGGQWVNCVSSACEGEALSMAKRQADLDSGVERMLALTKGTMRPAGSSSPAVSRGRCGSRTARQWRCMRSRSGSRRRSGSICRMKAPAAGRMRTSPARSGLPHSTALASAARARIR